MKNNIEKVKLKDSKIPIRIYTIDSFNKPLSSEYHMHKEIEIIYILEGIMRFTIEGHQVDLHADTLLFINSMVAHSSDIVSQSFVRMCLLQFPLDVIMSQWFNDHTSLSHLHEGYKFYTFKKGEEYANEIIDALLYIDKEFTKKKFAYEFFIKSKLILIMGILYRRKILPHDLKISEQQPKYVKEILKIIDFIKDNYKRNIGIQDISDALKINYYKCVKNFKKVTGVNIIQYINNYRLIKAKILLMDISLTITEIAEESGFQSAEYFSRIFKKHNGCSPSEYRQKLKDGQ